MHKKNCYVMYDQAHGVASRRNIKRVQQLRTLLQVAAFGLATLTYLAAASLITII